MLQLYKSTVRPILEYGSPVWCPWKKKHIVQIEQIQRRFTRLVGGLDGLNYDQRLKRLKLPILQYRRKREQLIQVYKVLNDLYDVDYRNFFEREDGGVTI